MRGRKKGKYNNLVWSRVVAALLLISVLVSVMPNAVAKRKTSGTFEGTKWSYNEKTKTLTLSCKGKMDDVLVRYYGDTWPWEEWAYEENGFDVEKLVIKEGVTYVGYYVTSLLLNLKSISLPKSLKRIGYGAFAYKGITKIALPPNLKTIDREAFFDTKLKEIVIPEGVTKIDKKAFGSCKKLAKAQLPARLNRISDGLFEDCFSLKTITIPSNVTRIGKLAFSGSGLTSITIPGKVTDIDRSAFLYCNSLKKCTFQTKKLRVIDVSLFEGCKKLKSVVLPNSVVEIKKQAFKESGLTSVAFPKNITSIEKEAFINCTSLKKVTFKTGKLTRISASLFEGCKKLTSIKLPDSITKIKKQAFKGSGLTAITIHEKVTAIEEEAFANCKDLKEVTFAGSRVINIGSNAFRNVPEDCVFKVPTGQAETIKAQLIASGLADSITVTEY